MLQFPTNIYPQNVAFDPTIEDTYNRLRFIFNGDILTTANFKIYDYNSGELVSESHYSKPDRTPWHYNGEEATFRNGTLGDDLTVGNDYVIQMMLTQSLVDGSENICDMPVVRGKVVSVISGSAIKIEDGIENIYEWEISGGLNVPTYRNNYQATEMVMQIGDESRSIVSYNKATGDIVLDSAFTTTPSAGDGYTIYSNYLVTPQYYFMCRRKPSVAVITEFETMVGTSGVIDSVGTFSQVGVTLNKRSLIKYYYFTLYWSPQSNPNNWIHIKTSPKIYSQKVNWKFLGSLIGVNTSQLPNVFDVSTVYYKAECTVVTNDGMFVASSNISSMPPNTSETAFTDVSLTASVLNENMPDYIDYETRKKHQAVRVDYAATTEIVPADYVGTVYRRNLETNEVVYVGTARSNNNLTLIDYTVPNKGSFEYVYVPREKANGRPYVNGIAKATINTNMTGYTVTSLIPYDEKYDTYMYSIGDCWKFVGEIDDVTITQNINRVAHVGTGNYSSVSMDDVNYASGSLSAMIGAVDCTDKKYKDTVDMVKAWREFITKNSVFMLKSQKGDVWIVNITESPSTTYSEMERDIPTTFQFNWAECMDLNKVLIKQ